MILLSTFRHPSASRALLALLICALVVVSTWGRIHAVEHGSLQHRLASSAQWVSDADADGENSVGVVFDAHDHGGDDELSAAARSLAASGHTAQDCLVLDHLASTDSLYSTTVLILLRHGEQELPTMLPPTLAQRYLGYFWARGPPDMAAIV